MFKYKNVLMGLYIRLYTSCCIISEKRESGKRQNGGMMVPIGSIIWERTIFLYIFVFRCVRIMMGIKDVEWSIVKNVAVYMYD